MYYMKFKDKSLKAKCKIIGAIIIPLIYIIFLLVLVAVGIFSFRLASNNSFEQDKIDYQKMYEEKKVKEGSFYLKLINFFFDW